MDTKPRKLTALLQDYITTAIALQHCSDLDDMREYDWQIDAHDAWVEHGQDELALMQQELADKYDIHLTADTISNNDQTE